MASSRSIIYWDSCVFLSYINGIEDRMPTLDALLDHSSSDESRVKIHSSALARVEVAFGASEREARHLDPALVQKIDALWDDPAAVVTVEYHDGIGVVARQLMRTAVSKGWSLKPLDAVHLATALWLEQAKGEKVEFHTYDERLEKYKAITGFVICRPYVIQGRLM